LKIKQTANGIQRSINNTPMTDINDINIKLALTFNSEWNVQQHVFKIWQTY